jgi:hypothetical protein
MSLFGMDRTDGVTRNQQHRQTVNLNDVRGVSRVKRLLNYLGAFSE